MPRAAPDARTSLPATGGQGGVAALGHLGVPVEKYHGKYDQGWDRIRAERHERQKKLKIVDPRWPLSPRSAPPPIGPRPPTWGR